MLGGGTRCNIVLQSPVYTLAIVINVLDKHNNLQQLSLFCPVNPVALHRRGLAVVLDCPSSTFAWRDSPNNNYSPRPHAGNPPWNKAYKNSRRSVGTLECTSYRRIARKTCKRAIVDGRREAMKDVVRGTVVLWKPTLQRY